MRITVLAALAITLLTLSAVLSILSAADGTIRVLTDRTESHLKPLFDHFEKNAGIQIEAVYVDKGLLPRLQAQPTEADVVITKTAENMERARQEGLLQSFESDILSSLEPHFIDPDN
ncbi:MAG: hypothetical protein ACOCXA_07300, partial [Planctomycetota bacterium]